MATLALAVAGAAVGSALLPAGVTVFGATLSGAMIGSQIGALAGSYIDQSLLGGSSLRSKGGPRLDDLKVTASTEGAPIARIIGRARLGGQVIWATPFEEEVVKSGGGKGAPLGGSGQKGYRYYANFAVALCEGPITSIGRVWADGTELDLSRFTWRLYTGTEAQSPDSLIATDLGTENAPAYRGVAYIVFEHLPLEDFGNRLPQLSFEVFRSVDPFDAQVRAVVMIPGSGEFVYATEPVTRDVGAGASEAENFHSRQGGTDWEVALDQLQSTLPNVSSVSLVVSWFGTDLRAGECRVRPAVDAASKITKPLQWRVAGLDRGTADVVSTRDGRAAYGGTPSDDTVVAAIRDLKARGLRVTLNPFILMDIAADNALVDPYTGAAGQPAYPWRGRITVAPAAGQSGTVDKSAAAAAQIATFVGTATPADFAIADEVVVYSGPAEWSLRRMLLHYAHLAVAAGGVDAFILCSELRGLTQSRASTSSYPFVDALVALAADVRAVLGPSTKLTYGADWTEYFGHQPQDGSGDVHFHLDPLWASPSIDAIGIDAYWPLADWRDGRDHADSLAGARSIYDLAYLKSNLAGGEGFDWYYASPVDRDAQLRTPITDGGAGKPWVFRTKDLRSWWLEAHYDRPGGIESATPTAWVPQSKPFWLTEIGCPAVDKGANQPNVFVDEKSAESALPYYSSGARDDLMQRRYLQALIEGLDADHPAAVSGLNPLSTITGARMVDLDNAYVYAWDARPHPAFPANTSAWGDGGSWRQGHWLNGRLAAQPLAQSVSALLASYGFDALDADELDGSLPGYVIDRIMSARDALQPLELAYFFDTLESDGRIVMRHRGAAAPIAELTLDDLVEEKAEADLLALTRAQETDLPASAKIAYAAYESDYRQAVAEARRLVGASGRIAQAELPIVMEADQATRVAESWLFESWAAREHAAFALPPSYLGIEPGDALTLPAGGRSRLFRVTDVGDHGAREIEARRIEPGVYLASPSAPRPQSPPADILSGTPVFEMLDLPLLRGTEREQVGYVAAVKRSWPGSLAVYRSPEDSDYALRALIAAPATMGETVDALPRSPTSRFDRATTLRVRLDGGTLVSVSRSQLLAGANACAIRHALGVWEVLQFQTATLVSPSTYELSGILRGQAGTEWTMTAELPAGARLVLLDDAVTPVDMTFDDIGLPFNWRVGPASRDLGSPSYATASHAFLAVGRYPLSPVHVRGRRLAGDLLLNWVRRTRIGGDSWEGTDVPNVDGTERYEIDIVDGATVVRTITASMPSAVYSVTEQMADFGAPVAACTVRIYQLGVSVGRGRPAEAVV